MYIKTREVAEILGLHADTVRAMDKRGTLVPDYIDPVTKYRFYDKERIEKLAKGRDGWK